MVVTSALAVFFIFLVLGLIARHILLPGILILGSFILFVLWLTGLIETSLQLYGVVGGVNDSCQNYVVDNPSRGNNMNTLAYLTQATICKLPLTPGPISCFWFLTGSQVIAGKQRSHSSS